LCKKFKITETRIFISSVFKNKGAEEKKLTATKSAIVGIQARVGEINTVC
jgi:hypothetical protein